MGETGFKQNAVDVSVIEQAAGRAELQRIATTRASPKRKHRDVLLGCVLN